MNKKVIVATVVLGTALLVGGVATGTYFIGKNAGKKAQLEAGTDTMKNTMDTVAQVQPAQPEAQAEDTVQMTPEEIAKHGIDIAPNEKPAEKVGFKPKKTQTHRVVNPDTTNHLKKGEKFRLTPEMFDKYDEEPSLVKIYRVVEAENDGR